MWVCPPPYHRDICLTLKTITFNVRSAFFGCYVFGRGAAYEKMHAYDDVATEIMMSSFFDIHNHSIRMMQTTIAWTCPKECGRKATRVSRRGRQAGSVEHGLVNIPFVTQIDRETTKFVALNRA